MDRPNADPGGATERDDRIELWGRRIGRALGWIVAAFLIFQLLRTYGT